MKNLTKFATTAFVATAISAVARDAHPIEVASLTHKFPEGSYNEVVPNIPNARDLASTYSADQEIRGIGIAVYKGTEKELEKINVGKTIENVLHHHYNSKEDLHTQVFEQKSPNDNTAIFFFIDKKLYGHYFMNQNLIDAIANVIIPDHKAHYKKPEQSPEEPVIGIN